MIRGRRALPWPRGLPRARLGAALSLALLCFAWTPCRARALPPADDDSLPFRSRTPARASTAPLFVRLSPRSDELQRERVRALEQRLVDTLMALPEVRAAAVQLGLPAQAELPLDRPLPAPSASVVLRVRGEAPSRAELWQLVRAAVPDLALENLAVVVRSTPQPMVSPEPLVSVGPFRVAADSAAQLRIALALLLGVNTLLAGLVLARSRRAVVARTMARWAAKRSR